MSLFSSISSLSVSSLSDSSTSNSSNSSNSNCSFSSHVSTQGPFYLCECPRRSDEQNRRVVASPILFIEDFFDFAIDGFSTAFA